MHHKHCPSLFVLTSTSGAVFDTLETLNLFPKQCGESFGASFAHHYPPPVYKITIFPSMQYSRRVTGRLVPSSINPKRTLKVRGGLGNLLLLLGGL